jgi:tripeptide aminopeptidase
LKESLILLSGYYSAIHSIKIIIFGRNLKAGDYQMKDKVVERFLRYVKYDTRSDPHAGVTPSTPGQMFFARMLSEELKRIGMEEVEVDKNGYVTATLPSNIKAEVPVVGFIAHMDTSPDFTGKDISPKVVESYPGGDIILDKEQGIILSPAVFPEIEAYKGQDLIVTNGKTLLGADDKAGVAEIVTAMEYLAANPEIRHGKIKIAFTPDEEIGQGADHFDVKKFGADFAYTMDGGEIGALEYENFNAAGSKIVVHGISVHPGYAKNKMKNSMLIANRFISMLPQQETPENSEGYEGFFHLTGLHGEIERTEIEYIIRDFDKEGFKERKRVIENAAEKINYLYGKGTLELTLKNQYHNMREVIEPVKYVVDIAEESIRNCGIKPKMVPVRGGTDGARLSYMGLPCPNIFAGGHNFHGKFEYIPIPSMEKACLVIVEIAGIVGKMNRDGR